VSGKEAPIMQQPLTHSQRGAPLTFNDLGACVRVPACSCELHLDIRLTFVAPPAGVAFPRAFGDGASFSMSGLFSNGEIRASRACTSHASAESFLHCPLM
jgi:hypothetical protein